MPAVADSTAVRYTVAEGVATVTLTRPDVMNAVDVPTIHALRAAFKQAAKDDAVRCVVLTGEGRAFCAGADLAAGLPTGADGTFHLGEHVVDAFNPLVLDIWNLPKPVIAAVNGVAAGAGANLALACDLRIAAEGASFVQAFVKIGLIPDSGGNWFLPRLVGLAKAAELAFFGDKVTAAEALSLGLVNRVVPAEQLAEAVAEWAGRLSQGPTRAIALTKRALHQAAERDLAGALDVEAQLQELAGRTQDFKEGVTAFREKRPPRFTGK